MLTDHAKSLDIKDGWLLWDPSFDHNYPKTRQELGYSYYRGYRLEPSFEMPKNGSLLATGQSVVSIIRFGPWFTPFIEPSDIGNVTFNGSQLTDSVLNAGSNRILSNVVLIPNVSADWEFKSDTYQPELSGIEFDIRSGTGTLFVEVSGELKSGLHFEDYLELDLAGRKRIELLSFPGEALSSLKLNFFSNTNVDNLSIKFVDKLLPDIGYKANIVEDVTNISTSFIADDRHNTSWITPSRNEISLTISDSLKIEAKDLNKQKHQSLDNSPITLYRFSAIHYRDYIGLSPTNWVLEGSNDGDNWIYMDKQSGQVIPGGVGEYKSFVIDKPGRYRQYRFRFNIENLIVNQQFGLAELELYPKRK
jgi:hypothetical protein